MPLKPNYDLVKNLERNMKKNSFFSLPRYAFVTLKPRKNFVFLEWSSMAVKYSESLLLLLPRANEKNEDDLILFMRIVDRETFLHNFLLFRENCQRRSCFCCLYLVFDATLPKKIYLAALSKICATYRKELLILDSNERIRYFLL